MGKNLLGLLKQLFKHPFERISTSVSIVIPLIFALFLYDSRKRSLQQPSSNKARSPDTVTRPAQAWKTLPAFAWLDTRELCLCFARPEYHHSSREELAAFTKPEQRAKSVARLTGSTGEPLVNVVEHRV